MKRELAEQCYEIILLQVAPTVCRIFILQQSTIHILFTSTDPFPELLQRVIPVPINTVHLRKLLSQKSLQAGCPTWRQTNSVKTLKNVHTNAPEELSF